MSTSPNDGPPPGDIPPEKQPLLPRSLGLLIGLAAFFIAAQGIQPMRSTLTAAFLALNLVIVVWPIQRFLSRYIPRFFAALAAGFTALAVLGGMMWLIGWAIARLIQELPNYNDRFGLMIQSIVDWAERYNIDTNAVVQEGLAQLRGINLSAVASTLGGVVSGIGGVIVAIVMVALILFFMIVDSAGFSERMQRVGERHNPAVAWALTRFASGARKYWVVTTVAGLTVGTGNFFLLVAFDVPMPLVWAMLSVVTNYIPYVGFLIGLVPPTLMALLSPDPLTTLWVVIGYFVINTVITAIAQPKVAGNAVGITPTVAVMSVLIWGYILGPMGVLLAIPATLLVKTIFIDIDPRTRWLNAFIASNPTTSDQDPIRLSNLLDRAKRINKLRRVIETPGVTDAQAEAAHRELESLQEEAD